VTADALDLFGSKDGQLDFRSLQLFFQKSNDELLGFVFCSGFAVQLFGQSGTQTKVNQSSGRYGV
jgi:hypothetical protein